MSLITLFFEIIVFVKIKLIDVVLFLSLSQNFLVINLHLFFFQLNGLVLATLASTESGTSYACRIALTILLNTFCPFALATS